MQIKLSYDVWVKDSKSPRQSKQMFNKGEIVKVTKVSGNIGHIIAWDSIQKKQIYIAILLSQHKESF